MASRDTIFELMFGTYGGYVRRFGLATGSSLYWGPKLLRGMLRMEVPDLTHPVTLRGGTSDRSAFNEIFVRQAYDRPYPGEPRFIVDAGANIGLASVRFAQLYPDAHIVAVEPDGANFALTEQNIAPYPGASAVQAGVWPRTVRLTIENPDAKSWSFRVREAQPGESSFPAVSLADLMRQAGASRIDILKLDVEGAERELFADPQRDEWLARTNMLFVELHDRHRPGCTAAMESAIAPHAFRREVIGHNLLLVREKLLED